MKVLTKHQRGFALIVVLGLMAVLTAFLFAAQGSVLASHANIKRSLDRIERHEIRSSIFARCRAELADPALASSATPAEAAVGATHEIKRLAADDEIYQSTPGISHRPGDALIIINWDIDGLQESERFLMSASQGRSGVISLGKN
jgi:hypothetical protein